MRWRTLVLLTLVLAALSLAPHLLRAQERRLVWARIDGLLLSVNFEDVSLVDQSSARVVGSDDQVDHWREHRSFPGKRKGMSIGG